MSPQVTALSPAVPTGFVPLSHPPVPPPVLLLSPSRPSPLAHIPRVSHVPPKIVTPLVPKGAHPCPSRPSKTSIPLIPLVPKAPDVPLSPEALTPLFLCPPRGSVPCRGPPDLALSPLCGHMAPGPGQERVRLLRVTAPGLVPQFPSGTGRGNPLFLPEPGTALGTPTLSAASPGMAPPRPRGFLSPYGSLSPGCPRAGRGTPAPESIPQETPQ